MCSLTLRCDAHRSGKHIAELDSAVGSTPLSLTPQWDAHRGAFEIFWSIDSAVWITPRSQAPQHTAELDSLVGSTLWSQTTVVQKMPVFVFSYLLLLLTPFFRKSSEVKKIPKTILDLQYYFHINIFGHHREIEIVNLRIKTDTW